MSTRDGCWRASASSRRTGKLTDSPNTGAAIFSRGGCLEQVGVAGVDHGSNGRISGCEARSARLRRDNRDSVQTPVLLRAIPPARLPRPAATTIAAVERAIGSGQAQVCQWPTALAACIHLEKQDFHGCYYVD